MLSAVADDNDSVIVGGAGGRDNLDEAGCNGRYVPRRLGRNDRRGKLSGERERLITKAVLRQNDDLVVLVEIQRVGPLAELPPARSGGYVAPRRVVDDGVIAH